MGHENWPLIPTTAARIDILTTKISTELGKEDYNDLSPFFRHVKRFYGRALNLENIYGD